MPHFTYLGFALRRSDASIPELPSFQPIFLADRRAGAHQPPPEAPVLTPKGAFRRRGLCRCLLPLAAPRVRRRCRQRAAAAACSVCISTAVAASLRHPAAALATPLPHIYHRSLSGGQRPHTVQVRFRNGPSRGCTDARLSATCKWSSECLDRPSQVGAWLSCLFEARWDRPWFLPPVQTPWR